MAKKTTGGKLFRPLPLPCGCTRGEFHCPEAVRLWQRTGGIHQQILAGNSCVGVYNRAMDDYRRHFK